MMAGAALKAMLSDQKNYRVAHQVRATSPEDGRKTEGSPPPMGTTELMSSLRLISHLSTGLVRPQHLTKILNGRLYC
ncbi:hypothetical protein TNCT_436411 [Trichonephila clavata]|uniref:Uncharacterized protein n=1 Tax=Trichonephila clavata TaxID=2740835 RepID=A0A8X6JG60_TRICU|nr:hypothetical protein TNCT_436411 [Trichonephila clavata]